MPGDTQGNHTGKGTKTGEEMRERAGSCVTHTSNHRFPFYLEGIEGEDCPSQLPLLPESSTALLPSGRPA